MNGLPWYRLDSIRPVLAEAIRHADRDAQRSAAIGAAEAAVLAAGVDEPLITEAFRSLRAGAMGEVAGGQELRQLADHLDGVALRMDDSSEAGAQQYPHGYVEAFRRARAAQAVVHACDADPRTAALEGVYEALAAFDENDGDRYAAGLLETLVPGHPAATRWFRRRWEEARADDFASWGPATYFFETGDDGEPVRQIEVYDAGPKLRYGPGREEDQFGQLARGGIDRDEDWARWAISLDDFQAVWDGLNPEGTAP